MDLMRAMQISGTGLAANRVKMNVVAKNLANSETTKTADGGPYRREMVVFKEQPIKSFDNVLKDSEDELSGVAVSKIVKSQDDFRMVYNPAHPDADPNTGYVAMPNVNLLTEMADMIVAKRAYDANVAAISNTKSMILKALEIGK